MTGFAPESRALHGMVLVPHSRDMERAAGAAVPNTAGTDPDSWGDGHAD